jgi:hypothetical protein
MSRRSVADIDPASWDALAAAARARGLPTIAPSGVQAHGPDVTDDELFARLWASSDPRLRDAGTALLVVRPDLAGAAAAALRRVTGDARARAETGYAAAVALQRFWRPRLRQALGEQPLIPAGPVTHLGLPGAEASFGQDMLLELSRREEAARGYDAWAGYESLADQLLAELDVHSAGRHRRA